MAYPRSTVERAPRDGEPTALSGSPIAEPHEDPDNQDGQGSGRPDRFRGHATVQPHGCYSTSVGVRLIGIR